MSAKEQYTKIAATLDLPYYMEPWWMETVSQAQNKDWDVALATDGDGEILAAMPYHTVCKRGYIFAMTPQMTPYTNVWINRKRVHTPGERRAAVRQMTDQMRRRGVRVANFNMHEDFACADDFVAVGYAVHYRHSYVVDDISDPDELLLHYHTMKRRQVRKGQRNLVTNVGDVTPEEYHAFYSKCLARKQKTIFYNHDFFVRATTEAIAHDQGAFFSVRNTDGKLLAVLFCTWDNERAYALTYAFDHDERNSGASALVMHSAIEYLSTRTHGFDFEGGNARNVGASYSKYGTRKAICAVVRGSYGIRGWLLRVLVYKIFRGGN